MRKLIGSAAAAALMVSGLAAGATVLAAPASAGCVGATVVILGIGGGGRTCDSEVAPNGWFQRCVTGGGGAFGIGGGGTNCFDVDIRNMGHLHPPYHIP